MTPLAKKVFELFGKPEFATKTAEKPAWLCPHCGRPSTIDDVFSSEDGQRTLTLWRCDPCGVVAVTPDAIKEPPTAWVKNTEQ
ncbi:MAG: hypothetical protein AB7G75_29875 [Candidatus Binatia bacterium]